MDRRTAFSIGFGVLGAAFIVWVGFFKMFNADVWWHIRAGQVMWETKHLIHTDPFAYTRAGMPYLATHEWLAQLLFAATYALGGGAGIVVLRIASMLLGFGILLAIDRRSIWPNVLLVMGAAIATSQGFLERPQLFSNVLFAMSLLLCFRLLGSGKRSSRRTTPFALVGIEILWVNLHGAAALLLLIPLGAIGLQWLVEREWERARMATITGIGVVAASFVSPNAIGNFHYLWLLLTDRTARLLLEWNPSPWTDYLLRIGPFWLIAAAAIVWTRRKPVAAVMILLVMGILSRMALRHEVLFLITVLAVIFYELSHNVTWKQFLEKAQEQWAMMTALGLAVTALLIRAHLPSQMILARGNLVRLGSFSPAQGAEEFLERNHIDGKIFNTYLIGGYLLLRKRPVFIDGRNDDYGAAFLRQTFAANEDPGIWEELERRYGFTVAVIEYGPRRPGDPFSFTFLKDNTAWKLVYVDDWAAVYLKSIPEDASLIARFGYRVVTPESLTRNAFSLSNIPSETATLHRELERVSVEDPRGTKALLLLGAIDGQSGNLNAAAADAARAISRAPNQYEGYALLGSILAAEERWSDAATMFRRAISLARYLPVHISNGKIAEIFERAGDPVFGRQLRQMAR
ncbi:hypothetical protein HY285_02810 [Candidatus Peregrinibacteria bacterium]|nr:hypothetical protein [Candidatus Peregrinibacteria bacterium]MBI3816448.1 hypothetical protein [Candidatus Peregrinibacteria bacterium]